MVFERSTPSIRVKSEPRFAFAYLSVFATTSCFPDFLRVELIAKVNYPLRWQKTPSGFGRTQRLIGLLVHQTKEEAAIIESRHVDTKQGRAVGKHRTVNLVLRQARPIHLSRSPAVFGGYLSFGGGKQRALAAIQTLDKALHHKLPTNPGES